MARTIALRKLTSQARTRAELDRALRGANVPTEVADAVLDRLTEVGLVDDAVFATDWVQSRQQRRHLSRSALQRELQGKGIAREHIDSALSDVGYEAELAAATDIAQRRQAGMAGLPREVQYRRLAGLLGRRGFGSGVISEALGAVVAPDQGGA